MSHLLSGAGVDHVVLERSRAAARWDSHTWLSLRLLTPNWMSRLPGHRYRGPDPAGFMRAAEVGDYLRAYAALSAAPVTEGAEVLSVRRSGGGYRVVTTTGTWAAASVVIATGWCDLPYVPDLASPRPAAALREPSLQLSGQPGGRDLDLPGLQARGVGLTGRLTGVAGRYVRLAEDLAVTTRDADERLRRLLSRIDTFAESTGLAPEVDHAEPIRQAQVTGSTAELDLLRAGIRTVIWATGYRRSYPWLRVRVLDKDGDIRHVNGTTASPGLHVVGIRWQTRRSSSFLDGVRHDAALVVSRVLEDLRGPRERQERGMSAPWDVVVVGGRAAGASTAMLLARAGMRVLCVERTRLGSDTLSTHALMRADTLQLARWGLLDAVIGAGTPAVQRTLFHYGAEPELVTIRPAAGVDALYTPRRTLIDRLLVEAATAAGATFRFGRSVVGLDQHPSGRVTGVITRDRDGSVRAERAGLVIGADGRHSSVAEAVGATGRFTGRSASAFVYGNSGASGVRPGRSASSGWGRGSVRSRRAGAGR